MKSEGIHIPNLNFIIFKKKGFRKLPIQQM